MVTLDKFHFLLIALIFVTFCMYLTTLNTPGEQVMTVEVPQESPTAVVSCEWPDQRREFEDMTAKYRDARRRLGALSCEVNKIGPTGGFCLQKEASDVGGNTQWSPPVAELLRMHFSGQSVYDFGAGLGWYGRVFVRPETANDFAPLSYMGFDGAENVEEVTEGFIHWLDLAEPVHLPPVDWVLSLEVGEHIPAKFEDVFIGNLHRHTKKGIVLSWAVEGQSGHFHVNNHNNDYVKAKFEALGYRNDLEFETMLRRAATLPWFTNTLMVFVKK